MTRRVELPPATGLSRRRLLAVAPAAFAGLLAACRDRSGRASERPDGADGTRTTQPPAATSAPTTAPTTARPPKLVAAVATPGSGGLDRDPFRLGVASGDPLPDSVILWTRLNCEPTAPDGGLGAAAEHDLQVVWDVAEDPEFTRILASDLATAAARDGHSVHVDVTGLPADRWFHYRFRMGRFTSRTGRTRTAPAPDARPDRFVAAVAACQHFELGTYVAHRHLAAEGADLVIFLGDFIYEGPAGFADTRVRAHPTAEALDLASYRLRYAWYRRDEDLQAAQACAPWAVIWDDHEVVNNYAGDRPSEGEPSPAFAARRAAAYQAWWENQPVRLARPDAVHGIERELSWGRLARLVLLDGRSHRSPQACEGRVGTSCDHLDDEDRTMLGPTQEAWVDSRFAASAADDVTWTVLGNQTVLADLTFPLAVVPSTLFDQWDGYPAARRRLLTAARNRGVRNLVALTGDLHCSVAADLELGGDLVGSELVVSSISSSFAGNRGDLFELGLSVLDHVKLADTRRRGYVRAEFGAEEARFVFRHVLDVRDPASAIASTSSWRLADTRRGLRKA